MPTYRFPAVVWEDHHGSFTARLVEDMFDFLGLAGTADTGREALGQLKEYLAWSYKENSYRPAPDFQDPELAQFRVDVRPQYVFETNIYPSEQSYPLLVTCVHGRRESGILVCALPMLGFRFHYQEPKSLKNLVTYYVQESLKNLTPQQLSRFLPPKSFALDEVVVHVARPYTAPSFVPEIETLESVADALGGAHRGRRYQRAWERESEVSDLIRRITVEKANLMLVGPARAGKTTVLVDAVRQIERERGSEKNGQRRHKHQFWLTSGARLIAGMQYLGQWEERCEEVIAELANIDGVLCIDSAIDLVTTGGAPEASIAAFLSPYLQRGELRLVAEATPTELDAITRLLPSFADVFQIVKLDSLGRDKALAVLERACSSLEQNQKIEIDAALPETTYRLFRRFMPYESFPGNTITFLTNLVQLSQQQATQSVTAGRAVVEFAKLTGLPEIFLRDDVLLEMKDVQEFFNRRLIGQTAACEVAANIVATFKAGLNDPNRPIAVLLFCGPTGVGKTELARALSDYFFGHGGKGDRLLRLDMSEYAGAGAAERLLGTSTEPAAIVKKIREQPFSVVLLDEIEKAHPAVFDLLMGMFDEGRLTDSHGRVTAFQSAVVIMTSNLGAEQLLNVGFGKQQPPSYDAKARTFFRPEFYNRIDALVRFNSLTRDDVFAITLKELREVAEREGLASASLRLTWTERLIERIALTGFDERFGARPLQRCIETEVVVPLAKFLLDNPTLANHEVLADLDGEAIVFTCE